MKTAFELNAEFRDAQGKGASRRLRHENKVPAILYGGHREPRALALDHTKLLLMLDNERFYSTIINLKVGEVSQAAILKDVQRHPAKNAVRPRRPAARAREREDPHRDPAALQGRERGAGRQEGRRRVAPEERDHGQLPAEGPARVRRRRPVGARHQPDALPRGPEGSGGRGDHRTRARPQFAGGVRAPRACRGSRDRQQPPRLVRPRLAAAPAAAAPAADAKAAAKPAAEAKGKDAKK